MQVYQLAACKLQLLGEHIYKFRATAVVLSGVRVPNLFIRALAKFQALENAFSRLFAYSLLALFTPGDALSLSNCAEKSGGE